MDGSRKNFENIKNPEKLRDTMLTICKSKLAHSVGSKYSRAVITCLEKREWNKLERWEAQKLVREQVLQPLMETSKAI
jgi:hypothetical protein